MPFKNNLTFCRIEYAQDKTTDSSFTTASLANEPKDFSSVDFKANIIYSLPLDIFVRKKLEGEVEMQPRVAPAQVAASLRSGFLLGYGRPKPDLETFQRALEFTNYVTHYFKHNKYYDFETKMGSGRLKDLIGQTRTASTRCSPSS